VDRRRRVGRGGAGRLDVLVNNAGIFRLGQLASTTVDDWQQATGVFLGMKAAAPVMRAQRSGSIVNISSVAGLRGSAGAFAHGASKWAVRGMTKSAAQDLAPVGVRVNSVHPGLIATAMLDQLGEQPREALGARIPMGHTADADDVARLVLFLASDESAYCTGHEFVVDGGMTA
jgi:3alpha(or 20beta)-hydroxysteroid dehydrogenase